MLNEKVFQILIDKKKKKTPGPSRNDDSEVVQQLKEQFLETTEKGS
jgi:hypothetical protein